MACYRLDHLAHFPQRRFRPVYASTTTLAGGRLTSRVAAGESRRSSCWCQLTGFPLFLPQLPFTMAEQVSDMASTSGCSSRGERAFQIPLNQCTSNQRPFGTSKLKNWTSRVGRSHPPALANLVEFVRILLR